MHAACIVYIYTYSTKKYKTFIIWHWHLFIWKVQNGKELKFNLVFFFILQMPTYLSSSTISVWFFECNSISLDFVIYTKATWTKLNVYHFKALKKTFRNQRRKPFSLSGHRKIFLILKTKSDLIFSSSVASCFSFVYSIFSGWLDIFRGIYSATL